MKTHRDEGSLGFTTWAGLDLNACVLHRHGDRGVYPSLDVIHFGVCTWCAIEMLLAGQTIMKFLKYCRTTSNLRSGSVPSLCSCSPTGRMILIKISRKHSLFWFHFWRLVFPKQNSSWDSLLLIYTEPCFMTLSIGLADSLYVHSICFMADKFTWHPIIVFGYSMIKMTIFNIFLVRARQNLVLCIWLLITCLPMWCYILLRSSEVLEEETNRRGVCKAF